MSFTSGCCWNEWRYLRQERKRELGQKQFAYETTINRSASQNNKNVTEITLLCKNVSSRCIFRIIIFLSNILSKSNYDEILFFCLFKNQEESRFRLSCMIHTTTIRARMHKCTMAGIYTLRIISILRMYITLYTVIKYVFQNADNLFMQINLIKSFLLISLKWK